MTSHISCPNCTSTDLLSVALAPKDRPMQFHTCRHCEQRWWEDIAEGADVGLDVVIAELSS